MSPSPTTSLSTLPPESRALMEAIGPKWAADINAHRDLVIQTYTPLAAAAPNGGIAVSRDIPYGGHPRQVLDVFVDRAAAGENRPVVVFVHGGAFVRGKKSVNGHIYDNVCYWFARQGYVAVNVEYRLAQDAPYPGGGDDVAAAHRWVAEHIGGFGGQAASVFLIGHSAGGTHVATSIFDPAGAQLAVAGVVLISARLKADVLPDNPNAGGVRAYFGDDPALYEARSPMTHAHRSGVPLFVVIAEFENPYLDSYGAEFFARAAAARERSPRFMQVPLHNHTSIVAHFNSGEDALAREIQGFIEATLKERQA